METRSDPVWLIDFVKFDRLSRESRSWQGDAASWSASLPVAWMVFQELTIRVVMGLLGIFASVECCNPC